jgi:antitoxin (DNA-binding transcriptional repressor) of toxin-antitoxin stability system
MTDEIVLTIPSAPGFDRVAHLVLSGIAVRLNLTIENLEDLQIALDSLLDAAADGELTVTLAVRDSEVVARIGPINARVLDELEHEDEGALGRRRVLESTVDDVHVDGQWVRLTKKVTIVGG